MAQNAPPGRPADPLFAAPLDRLGARLHRDVFGALPSRTSRALDVPEVAAAVRPLLERGWRPAQLAARVGALPAAADEQQAVGAVTAFLGQLLERDSPQQVWARERAGRERERAGRAEPGHEVASDSAHERWVAEARRSLGLPPRPRPVTAPRPAPACASCGGSGQFFVTRQVRLCAACVELLAQGRARLTVSEPTAVSVRAG